MFRNTRALEEDDGVCCGSEGWWLERYRGHEGQGRRGTSGARCPSFDKLLRTAVVHIDFSQLTVYNLLANGMWFVRGDQRMASERVGFRGK